MLICLPCFGDKPKYLIPKYLIWNGFGTGFRWHCIRKSCNYYCLPKLVQNPCSAKINQLDFLSISCFHMANFHETFLLSFACYSRGAWLSIRLNRKNVLGYKNNIDSYMCSKILLVFCLVHIRSFIQSHLSHDATFLEIICHELQLVGQNWRLQSPSLNCTIGTSVSDITRHS